MDPRAVIWIKAPEAPTAAPLWWSGVRAMLKDYFNRVFVISSDFAYVIDRRGH